MFVAMDERRLDEAKVLVDAGADLDIQDQVCSIIIHYPFVYVYLIGERVVSNILCC